MKGKSNILKYIAATIGGVLCIFYASSNNVTSLNFCLGFIVVAVCAIYILSHSINSYLVASEKRREEKLAEKERYQEQKRQELKEKEDKYNAFRNELIARNGEPGRVVLIHESRFDQFNMNNELIVFDKVKFAPIDNIKECIKRKYGKTLDENCITVKKMVLGVYPLATDKEKNAVVPVWICFLERKTKGSEYVEKLYVPINAITGEEFYDMEG